MWWKAYPPSFSGIRVARFLLVFLCCVLCTVVWLFIFLSFGHGIVILLSTYEFECISCIFCLSFKVRLSSQNQMTWMWATIEYHTVFSTVQIQTRFFLSPGEYCFICILSSFSIFFISLLYIFVFNLFLQLFWFMYHCWFLTSVVSSYKRGTVNEFFLYHDFAFYTFIVKLIQSCNKYQKSKLGK